MPGFRSAALVSFALAAAAAAQFPRVVAADDLVIRESCIVRSPQTPLVDANGDGLLRIERDGIRVEFEGWLRGDASLPLDQLRGCAIRVTAKNVELVAPRVSGFKVGIHASGADGLSIRDGAFERNYAQRLLSTPEAEDGADWLFPHDNDENQWLAQHGAAIYVEDSGDVELARNRVRTGQNGILLDRVLRARVYDNDASFLSGWGLGLWRTSDSLITRNAFDFCVRGYSHGVYNRGQDSAGILMFEQCCRNVLAENSGTHGGDGFFGFGGKEALGEKAALDAFDHRRKGCNDNLFVGNDFSYAAAHGLELTFSFGNLVRENRFVENAICGIWGGYSQELHVFANQFARNGAAGYGAERGGINVEHARHVRIEQNAFDGDACGVRLWWDEDAGLAKLPWARANDVSCAANQIVRNTFRATPVAIQLQRCSRVLDFGNRFADVPVERDVDDGIELEAEPPPPAPPAEIEIRGATHPVGARAALAGREHIVMTEWGPYDWQAPLLQRVGERDGAHVWRFLGAAALRDARVDGPVVLERGAADTTPAELLVRPRSEHPGLFAYELVADSAGGEARASGVVERLDWRVRNFAWTIDPRQDEAGWRKQAADAPSRSLPRLRLAYGMGGPEGLAPDRFGTLADTLLALDAGEYEFAITSDDGVRVRVDGAVVHEDWTWHAPKSARARFRIEKKKPVRLEVEHFELDGYAVLTVELRRMPEPARANDAAGVETKERR